MVTPEQEAASVMRYILDAVGNLRPYYHNIPEEFAVPSVFFPMPEVTAEPDTFLSYSADYQWYVKFFAGTTGEAYGAGMTALTAIQAGRRLIPLLDADGKFNCPGVAMTPEALLSHFRAGQSVFAGQIPEDVASRARRVGVSLTDSRRTLLLGLA